MLDEDPQHNGTRCAQAEAWVPPYVAMAAAGALWSVMLAFEMRVFVIAGSVSQWYFAPVHSPTQGTTLRALGHAAGASFGTLCFASLVRRPAPSPPPCSGLALRV